jgi:hypothetical protein
MHGNSRRYYHGVPRIIAESNPFSVVPSQGVQEEDLAVVEFMKNFRVNLNIRQVY